jgi:ketosteroid isomerase-like protein
MIDKVLVPEELTRDQTAVWRAVTDLYASYLDGDRERLESRLAPDCTMWESGRPELRTKTDMVRARESGAPTPAGPAPHTLDAQPLVISVVGELAFEAHTLRALFTDTTLDQSLRCTSVLSRMEGQWRFIHHHEELLAPA